MPREEVIERLESIIGTYEILLGNGVNSDILEVDDIEAIKTAIKALSEEPKPGWWIWINDGVYRCSICRELACCESNYCPNCGAKLTGRIVI